MSNHNNPRRGDERRSEHGPRYENPDPGAGCNSTHVARSRAKWKRRAARSERRNGTTSSSVLLTKRVRPDDRIPTGIDELDELLADGISKTIEERK